MKLFFKKNGIKNRLRFGTFQLFHDGWFSVAADALLRKRMTQDAAPTYYYIFTHKGTTSNSVLFGGDPDTWYGKCIGKIWLHFGNSNCIWANG